MKPSTLVSLAIAVGVMLSGCNRGVPPAPTDSPTVQPVPTMLAPQGTTARTSPTPILLAGTITRTESECSIALPAEPILAGPVEFTAINETDSLVAFHIWRIEDGRTYERLVERIEWENDQVEAYIESAGPPSFVGHLIEVLVQPDTSGSRVGKVISGTYAVVCIRDYSDQLGKRPYAIVGPFLVK